MSLCDYILLTREVLQHLETRMHYYRKKLRLLKRTNLPYLKIYVTGMRFLIRGSVACRCLLLKLKTTESDYLESDEIKKEKCSNSSKITAQLFVDGEMTFDAIIRMVSGEGSSKDETR